MKANKRIINLIALFIGLIILLQPVTRAMIIEDAGGVGMPSQDFAGRQQTESGNRPPTYAPDATPEIPTSDTTTSGHSTVIKSWYRGIKGQVYEKTDNSSEIGGIGSTTIGIGGVRVDAFDTVTETIQASTYTDANGNFAFENLPEGEYKIYYKYGDTRDTSNLELALKYNGYDYIVSGVTGNNYETYTITQTELTHSGRGALQIMLVLDCSVSARYSTLSTSSGEKRIVDINLIYSLDVE